MFFFLLHCLIFTVPLQVKNSNASAYRTWQGSLDHLKGIALKNKEKIVKIVKEMQEEDPNDETLDMIPDVWHGWVMEMQPVIQEVTGAMTMAGGLTQLAPAGDQVSDVASDTSAHRTKRRRKEAAPPELNLKKTVKAPPKSSSKTASAAKSVKVADDDESDDDDDTAAAFKRSSSSASAKVPKGSPVSKTPDLPQLLSQRKSPQHAVKTTAQALSTSATVVTIPHDQRMLTISRQRVWEGSLDVVKLLATDATFLSRQISALHVGRLVTSFLANPFLPLCYVLCKLDWPADGEFTESDLYPVEIPQPGEDGSPLYATGGRLQIIGGNHSHQAVLRISDSSPDKLGPISRKQCVVYANLSQSDCVFLAEELNIGNSLHRSQHEMERLFATRVLIDASIVPSWHKDFRQLIAARWGVPKSDIGSMYFADC